MFRDRALHRLAQASDASQCGGSFPGIGKNRVVSIVPVLSWLAAFAGAVIALARGPRPLARAFVLDRLLRYVFIFPVGWGCGQRSATLSSRQEWLRRSGGRRAPSNSRSGSPNLGIGLAGLYAAFRSFEARLATNLVLACLLIGAGVGHLRDIVTAGNFAPGNAGPILFTDLLTPTAVFLLLWLARSRGEERQTAQRRTPAHRQG
jgi:hypothetical protein